MRKTVSNEREANLINNGHPKRAATIVPVRTPLLIPVKEATTALAVKVVPEIWIAKLRTDRVAIFRTSVSRISNAAASIAPAVAEVSAAVIALGVEDLGEVTASVAAEDSVAVVAALAGLAAAAEADGNN